MCGDSTSAEDVALLMNGEKADIAFTSPPYGAGNVTNLRQHYDPKNKKLESFYKTHKDKPEEWRHLFKDSLQNMIVYAQSQFVNVQMLADNKINMISVVNEYAEFLVDILIWDKTSGPPQMQKNVLNNTFEFIFCFDSENNSRSIRFGDFHGTQSNVLRIKTGCNQYANIHKAVFPIDLPLEIFQINTKCKSVLDLFGGTGTTLIACEQTNRQCRMMELDEHYCDVIRKRWAEYVHGEGCDWQSLTPEVK
jgi:DNA modification methylase